MKALILLGLLTLLTGCGFPFSITMIPYDLGESEIEERG